MAITFSPFEIFCSFFFFLFVILGNYVYNQNLLIRTFEIRIKLKIQSWPKFGPVELVLTCNTLHKIFFLNFCHIRKLEIASYLNEKYWAKFNIPFKSYDQNKNSQKYQFFQNYANFCGFYFLAINFNNMQIWLNFFI